MFPNGGIITICNFNHEKWVWRPQKNVFLRTLFVNQSYNHFNSLTKLCERHFSFWNDVFPHGCSTSYLCRIEKEYIQFVKVNREQYKDHLGNLVQQFLATKINRHKAGHKARPYLHIGSLAEDGFCVQISFDFNYSKGSYYFHKNRIFDFRDLT